jgi:hypothetical protein
MYPEGSDHGDYQSSDGAFRTSGCKDWNEVD